MPLAAVASGLGGGGAAAGRRRTRALAQSALKALGGRRVAGAGGIERVCGRVCGRGGPAAAAQRRAP